MNVTLHLILDELGYEYENFIGADANPSFAYAELLAARGADLSGRKLLVCPLSEALDLADGHGGVYFLCIRDRMVDEKETPEAMRGISVIKQNMELRELFNEVQRIFFRVSGWIIDMQRSVMENEGIQALISLSEDIIGNHITVMDSTFKLLAYTQNIETDDPSGNSLIQYGYHLQETVKQLRLHQRFAEFEKADGIVVSDDFVISKYVAVKKIFHDQDSYSVLLVMTCNVKPFSDGLLDLFQLLVSNLQVYVARDYSLEGESGPMKALICDILEQKVAGVAEVRNRAANAGLAFQSDYDLFLVAFDDTSNTPISRLIQALSSRIQNACILSYQRGILILNRYEGARVADRENRLEYVKNMIGGDLPAWCGISTRFSTLLELPSAYGQASAAIRLGLRLCKRTVAYTDVPDHGKLFYFEDYALFSLALTHLTHSRDGLLNTFSWRAIQTLADYDKKHNVSTLRVLHTYLLCERRATEACARLHMHRNTVLYHIGRIEEILDVSLDDPEVRFKLLLGFKTQEMEAGEGGDTL